MAEALDLLRDNRTEDLWNKCCGFININIEQFMTIQNQLLMEQIELLKNCELGKKLLQGNEPKTLEEFREQVPLTLYDDYMPHLSEKIETGLPEKPLLWQRTSGRSSEYSNKWVPITNRMYRELGDFFIALLMFSSCTERGEVAIQSGDRFLYALAPPPYASGCWAHRLDEEEIFRFLPSVDEAEKMEFQDRIEAGFRMGMTEGIDMMAAIASILVAVGERFGKGGSIKRLPSMLNKPRILGRLLRGVIKSKLARRPLMPKDIWSIKGLVSTGTDSNVYRETIKEMWGRYPLDIYGATESIIIAMQTWDYGDMTFVPNLNLLEFLPEAEHAKWAADHTYKPRILLLNEVIPGERYVIVITNFLGGAFVRYVLEDIVTITDLRNSNLNINIPQMTFYGRASDIIDFEAFTHAFFTEKMLWQGISNIGCDYVDWVARKEVIKNSPMLHIYIELKEGQTNGAEELTASLHEELKTLNEDYDDLERFFGFKPLKVTVLPQGAFNRYMQQRRDEGADIAHLKPPHMNPKDRVIESLLGVEVPSAAATDETGARINT
jgi:hypothetical protein